MFGLGPFEIVALIMTLGIYAGVLVGMGMAIYFIVRKAVREEIKEIHNENRGESNTNDRNE